MVERFSYQAWYGTPAENREQVAVERIGAELTRASLDAEATTTLKIETTAFLCAVRDGECDASLFQLHTQRGTLNYLEGVIDSEEWCKLDSLLSTLIATKV